MPFNPEMADTLEQFRQKFCPNIPQEAHLAIENFLFFIGLLQ